MKNNIELSIVVPILNEGKFIDNLLDSVMSQEINPSTTELLLIDGGSTDTTIQKVKEHKINSYMDVVVLENKNKTVQYAMNIGIEHARGDYLIRLDAHSIYPTKYCKELVYSLQKHPEVGNVGGVWEVHGQGYIGKAYATVLSNFFGVGDSKYRLSKKESYVNTVPFGAFRKDVLQNIGGFDEKLERNEDFELNTRFNRSGYKVLLRPDLIITYFCRNTIKSIYSHEISDGKWNVYSFIVAPYTFSVSHFIPLAFVLSYIVLCISMILSWNALSLLILIGHALYWIIDLVFSIQGARKLGASSFPILLFLYPLHHIGCGIGALIGIFTCYKFIK